MAEGWLCIQPQIFSLGLNRLLFFTGLKRNIPKGSSIRRIIIITLAAIYYFIESEDDEHDFDSILGFDDDIQVMNKIVNHLGYANMEISND